MARIIIQQYQQTRVGSAGEATLQLVEPQQIRETVPLTTAPNLSSAFAHEWVQVQSDVPFYVEFGESPVVDGSGFSYPAGAVFTFAVQRGHRASVMAV